MPEEKPLPDDDYKTLARLYRDGKPLIEIAEQVGLSLDRCSRETLVIRDAWPLQHWQKETLANLDELETATGISEALHRKASKVRRRFLQAVDSSSHNIVVDFNEDRQQKKTD